MGDELVLLIEKNKDLFNNQERPQETSKIKLTKSTDSFSLITPLELEDEKWMIDVSKREVNISVYKITKHNSRSAVYTTGYWEELEAIKELLGELLEQRKLNEIIRQVKVKED